MIPVRGAYTGGAYRLYDEYNDIHVFVEDSGFENLYRELFNRCDLNVRKVFSLNGKDSIVNAAIESGDNKCVYLVDRDWNDLLGIEYSQSNLIVLEKYSVENYLINHYGFLAILIAEKPREDINSVFSLSEFKEIVDDISSKLRPLFECYLSMQVVDNDPQKNCSIKPGHYETKNKKCEPNDQLIAEFLTEISMQVPANVRDYFRGDVLLNRGHGKYMLHFIWNGIRHKTGVKKIGMDSLMVRLAQVGDNVDFKEICDKVVALSAR